MEADSKIQAIVSAEMRSKGACPKQPCNGKDFLKEVKGGRFKNKCIIIMASFIDLEDEKILKDLGADAVMDKGDIVNLLGKIHEFTRP